MGVAITKAILEAVGTDFLLKTGDTMSGTLNMGSQDIDMVKNIIPLSHLGTNIGSTAKYVNIVRTGNVYWTLSQIALASAYIKTDVQNYRHIYFQSYDTAYRTVMDMVNGLVDIPRAGDITLLATKSLDAYANAGYVKIRRLSQSEEPTPEEGEILLWRDTDDDTTYLMYEDVDVGTRKVELT